MLRALQRDRQALLFGRIACLVLGFMLFAFEWHYNQSGDGYMVPRILSYPGYLLGPFLCVLAAELNMFRESPQIRETIRKFLTLYYAPLLLVAIAQVVVARHSVLDSGKFALLEFVMIPVWGVFGILLGRRLAVARHLMGWLAIGCAVGSLLSGLLWIALPPGTVGLLARASWPIRLVFLFGGCWFLTHWFASRRFLDWNLVGMLACMVEGVISLHKPIIFGVASATFGIVWLSNRGSVRRHFHGKSLKLLFLGVTVLLSLGAVDYASQGTVSENLKTFWYQKVFHLSEKEIGMPVELGREGIERAAGGRFEIWGFAMQSFARHALVGSGFPEFLVERGESISIHNGYVDWLLGFGILGTLPIVAIWLRWGKSVLRRRPDGIREREVMIVAVAGYVIAMAAFNVGGTVRLFWDVCYFVALVAGMVFRLSVDPGASFDMQPVKRNPPGRAREW